MEYLGLHNKPKAEVHPGHLLTDPEEEEEEEEEDISYLRNIHNRSQSMYLKWRYCVTCEIFNR
jgi:hypothetical protein